MNQNFAAITSILETNGMAKEECLLATQAKAFMFASSAEFAGNILPAELQIFKTVEDGDVACDRFIKELALTLAVIHGSAMYVKAGLEGREYDSSIVMNSFNSFSNLNAEQQRDLTIETLRFADGVFFDLLTNDVDDARVMKEIDSKRGIFDDMVKDLAGKHINVMLENFGTVVMFLASVALVAVRMKSVDSNFQFGDAVLLHKAIGQEVTARLKESADDALAHMIRRNMQLNLPADAMESIDNLVMSFGATRH